VKWLADENFDNNILRGVRRRSSGFDVVRVQDISEISGAGDPAVLAWAAANGRTLLTHDLSTMIPAMQGRLRLSESCAPVVLVPDSLAVSQAIGDILLLDEYALDSDWAPGVLYLPLG
jgi:hypothetical protein